MLTSQVVVYKKVLQLAPFDMLEMSENVRHHVHFIQETSLQIKAGVVKLRLNGTVEQVEVWTATSLYV